MLAGIRAAVRKGQGPFKGVLLARHFDNWLKAYFSFTVDSESPDDFHFWTGVWTIAGALKRRVWIDMRKFQWTPNFYIVLVAPPGIAAKSTSMRIGRTLLDKVEPKIKFGPQSMTWQALTESLQDAIEHLEQIDPQTGEVLYVPMSCLTIPVSELGTFLKIDDAVLVDVLVDMWDGQMSTWSHRTKTSGEIEIKNPWLNVIGCTTPSWLKTHFPDNLVGGGLTSRIVFIYGDAKRKLIPYPDEVIKDSEYRTIEKHLVEDLTEIAHMSGEYILDSKARTWGREWYAQHWNEPRPLHMASDRYAGYLARKQTHIHKLAIVLAAARSNKMLITAEHLIEANELLSIAETHMLKVFESIGVVMEAKHTRELMAYVKAHEWLTADELWKCVMNLMSQKDFEEALKAAIRGDLLKISRRNGRAGVSL